MIKQETLKNLKKGTCWINHSTTDPFESLKLSKVADEYGILFLEAPLTGGMELLRQGMMIVYIGGDKQTYEKHLPILKCYTGTQLHMGKISTASIVKIISNQLAAVHLVATGEAVMMAKKCGVDLKSFFNGIRVSAGNSYVFETEAPLIFNGTFDPSFHIKLHTKDLNIGYNLGQKYDCPQELHAHAEQIYNRARIRYGGEVGSSYPAKLLQDDLNESLQIPGFDDWSYKVQKVEDGFAVVHTKKQTPKL